MVFVWKPLWKSNILNWFQSFHIYYAHLQTGVDRKHIQIQILQFIRICMQIIKCVFYSILPRIEWWNCSRMIWNSFFAVVFFYLDRCGNQIIRIKIQSIWKVYYTFLSSRFIFLFKSTIFGGHFSVEISKKRGNFTWYKVLHTAFKVSMISSW